MSLPPYHRVIFHEKETRVSGAVVVRSISIDGQPVIMVNYSLVEIGVDSLIMM